VKWLFFSICLPCQLKTLRLITLRILGNFSFCILIYVLLTINSSHSQLGIIPFYCMLIVFDLGISQAELSLYTFPLHLHGSISTNTTLQKKLSKRVLEITRSIFVLSLSPLLSFLSLSLSLFKWKKKQFKL
jgi:hypothetical protein